MDEDRRRIGKGWAALLNFLAPGAGLVAEGDRMGWVFLGVVLCCGVGAAIEDRWFLVPWGIASAGTTIAGLLRRPHSSSGPKR